MFSLSHGLAVVMTFRYFKLLQQAAAPLRCTFLEHTALLYARKHHFQLYLSVDFDFLAARSVSPSVVRDI